MRINKNPVWVMVGGLGGAVLDITLIQYDAWELHGWVGGPGEAN